MMSLNMVEAKLPPGFRFHPRDDELICDYLMKRVACCDQPAPLMIQVDLNKCEPWDIPESACVGGKEYYFYSLRDRKYATGLRTNRATISGYWKATGKDRPVLRKGTLMGMRKTLVFYQGRAPKGRKSDWVMHEFRLEGPLIGPSKFSSLKEDWVLCRVFFKNRDIVAKQEMMGFYGGGEESSTPSTSLPPLMDPFIAFDQTHQTNCTTNEHEQEQVPCFSIFATSTDQSTHQPNNQLLSYLTAHMEAVAPNFSAKSLPTTNLNGGFPPDLGPYNLSSSSSSSYCDDQKKVLKAVLNQLTTYGGSNNILVKGISSPSFGEAASTSDSLLSEVALSTMWNNQFSSSS